MANLIHVLRRLLPSGPAWPRPPAPNMDGLLQALAVEADLTMARAKTLLKTEADPRKTVEMLSDWERAYGLPDCIEDQPPMGEERRARLVEKISIKGGASIERIKRAALVAGYAIEIVDKVTPYHWEVHAAETTIHYFRTGQGLCGDRLRTWGNEVLECVIEKIKPAHTVLTFVYGGGGAPEPPGPEQMPIFQSFT